MGGSGDCLDAGGHRRHRRTHRHPDAVFDVEVVVEPVPNYNRKPAFSWDAYLEVPNPDGLAAELFTKKLALRGAAKNVLLQLAELCGARSGASDEAQNISRELFFGYVLRKSDFAAVEIEK